VPEIQAEFVRMIRNQAINFHCGRAFQNLLIPIYAINCMNYYRNMAGSCDYGEVFAASGGRREVLQWLKNWCI
jgi:hypothetical protein